MYLFAIIFPPLGILLAGRPFLSLIALAAMAVSVMFITGLIVTWIVLAIWALFLVSDRKKTKRHAELVNAIKSQAD